MAIPAKQIGWSQKSNLLWNISKQLETLIQVAGNIGINPGTTTTTSTSSSTTTTTTTPPIPFSGTVDIIASPYCVNSPSYSSNVSGDSSFCNCTQFTSGTFMTIPAGTWAIRDQITLSLLNITTNGSGVAIVDTGVVCYECTTTTTTTTVAPVIITANISSIQSLACDGSGANFSLILSGTTLCDSTYIYSNPPGAFAGFSDMYVAEGAPVIGGQVRYYTYVDDSIAVTSTPCETCFTLSNFILTETSNPIITESGNNIIT